MSEQKFNAADYKTRRNERASAKTFEVTLPSGFKFVLRRPNMSLYIAGGVLPSAMIEKMLQANNKGADFEKTFASMPVQEQMSAIEFTGALVRDACVVPRIVLNPRDETEIRFEDLDDEDFLFILNWAKGGGVDGDNVTKFRAQSAAAGSGDNGEEFQPSPV